MNNNLVGRVLPDEKDEEYVVLNELAYKSIKCVYAIKETNGLEKEKKFFQLTNDGEPRLVNINSQKMIDALNASLIEEIKKEKMPRKINEEESIADYLAYLDDYYKTKIVTIL